jgi:hypothetical protein
MSYRPRSSVRGPRGVFGGALIAGIAVSLLAACSTLPPEDRPKSPTGTVGFDEVRLAPNRYRVEFSGSTTSSRREVENRLTQRAAEVTLQSGYTHFVINMRDTGINTTRTAGFIPDNYLHGPYYFPRARRWSNIPLAFEGLQTNYVATADIAMLRGDEVPQNVAALSAVDVITGLQPSPPLAIASVRP